jgi:hypothetical protein
MERFSMSSFYLMYVDGLCKVGRLNSHKKNIPRVNLCCMCLIKSCRRMVSSKQGRRGLGYY